MPLCEEAHGPVPGHGATRDELWVEGFRVVEVSHAATLCLGAHAHDTAKLCVVLDGGVSERCGVDLLSPGLFEPVFRPAGVEHANQYHANGARSLLVEIDPDFARAHIKAQGLGLDRAQGKALALVLTKAFRATGSGRPREVLAAARAMVDFYAEQPRPRGPAWLDAAREALAREAVAPPTLDALAKKLGVHPVYLAQSFRARFGVTTRAFVRAHRVFRAMQQVRGGVALADAAADAGFADQSHMTRAVRAERGAPPSTLRRRDLSFVQDAPSNKG